MPVVAVHTDKQFISNIVALETLRHESVADQIRQVSDRRIVELQTALTVVAPRLRYSKHGDGEGATKASQLSLAASAFLYMTVHTVTES